MKQIATALVKAQKAFGPALKTHTNPAFRSKYADLSACVEAVMDALNDQGIAMMQQTREDATGVTVETVFIHESGESISSGPLHVPASKQDPQGYGSALTYARRYSLMAACGIAPEDDDGNAASKRKPDERTPVRMPENVLADWLAYVGEAGSVGDLKKRAAEAETGAAADPDALSKIRAAVATKLAQAKPAKEAA